MTRKTDDATLIAALRILAGNVYSGNGVASARISEAADRLDELTAKLLKREKMATADDKKNAAIQAVKDLFEDTSVSRSTIAELLSDVSSEIDDRLYAIEDDGDDED